MRPSATLAAVLLALGAVACQQSALTTPSPTIPVTDLSSIRPPATASPSPAGTIVATQQPTPIDLTPTDPPATPSPSPSPSPAATGPVAAGSPAPDCIDGWISPAPRSDEFEAGLALLSGYMGVAGPWTVSEMRYFTGPDSPGIIEPVFESVERWYIRAALVDDQSFGARWLLEKRTDLIQGVSAVAPFASAGYVSPDWTGFVGEGEPTSYLGLPGQWSGIPYDFVTGEGDSGQPGLPDEVVGCLSET